MLTAALSVSQTFQNHLHDTDKETKEANKASLPQVLLSTVGRNKEPKPLSRGCVFSRRSCPQQASGGYVVTLRPAFRVCSNCAEALGGYEDQADASRQDWEDSPGMDTVGIRGS